MPVLSTGCGWPIAYCPAQAVSQRQGRSMRIKGWQSEWPPAGRSAFYQSRWPFYQGRPASGPVPFCQPKAAKIARSLDSSCEWLNSYCPVQGVFGRAIFVKGWQANGRCIKAIAKPIAVLFQAGQPQWPFYQQWPLCQGLAPFYRRSGQMARLLRLSCRWPISCGPV